MDLPVKKHSQLLGKGNKSAGYFARKCTCEFAIKISF